MIKVLKKIQNNFRFFIAPNKVWKKPKMSEVLIYDACGKEFLTPYLEKYIIEILEVRGESINYFAFFKAMLQPLFWKGKPYQAYINQYIKISSPKIIITYIDNNKLFYEISKSFPNIKTIFIQNGRRTESGDIFGILKKMNQYHVDYMLVFGSAIGNQYLKFLSGTTIPIGSFKNNNVEKKILKTKKLVFISQVSNWPINALLYQDASGNNIDFNQLYQSEKVVLGFLDKWCAKHEIPLTICGRGDESSSHEIKFYDDNLPTCAWEFTPRFNSVSSYEIIDTAEITICIDSTLGYESLGRGNKTAFFSCRGIGLNSVSEVFGWPAHLPDNGPFWSNIPDEKEFLRVMNYLKNISDEEWDRARQFHAKELMEYDPGNTRFVALLDQLLPQN